jgi:hypothetical protein
MCSHFISTHAAAYFKHAIEDRPTVEFFHHQTIQNIIEREREREREGEKERERERE